MRSLPLDDPGTPPLSGPTALLWWLAGRQWGILLTAVGLGILHVRGPGVHPVRRRPRHRRRPGATASVRTSGARAARCWRSARSSSRRRRSATGTTSNELAARRVHVLAAGRPDRRRGRATRSPRSCPTGEVVSAVANDALRIGEVFALAAHFLGSLVAYGIVAVLMLRVSVPLGLVVILGLPTVAAILGLLVKPLSRRQAAQREASGRLTTLGSDTVSGLRILRGIGGEEVFIGRYRDAVAGDAPSRGRGGQDAVGAGRPAGPPARRVRRHAHLARRPHGAGGHHHARPAGLDVRLRGVPVVAGAERDADAAGGDARAHRRDQGGQGPAGRPRDGRDAGHGHRTGAARAAGRRGQRAAPGARPGRRAGERRPRRVRAHRHPAGPVRRRGGAGHPGAPRRRAAVRARQGAVRERIVVAEATPHLFSGLLEERARRARPATRTTCCA